MDDDEIERVDIATAGPRARDALLHDLAGLEIARHGRLDFHADARHRLDFVGGRLRRLVPRQMRTFSVAVAASEVWAAAAAGANGDSSAAVQSTLTKLETVTKDSSEAD